MWGGVASHRERGGAVGDIFANLLLLTKRNLKDLFSFKGSLDLSFSTEYHDFFQSYRKKKEIAPIE